MTDNGEELGLLRFDEHYFERIWGGQRLASMFSKEIATDRPVGEAWLLADHSTCESVVIDGPHAGKSLRALLTTHANAILGTNARLTPHGRFPLLLKMLDANDVLSLQVHPSNADAARLGEPDIGKTEMWYVMHAERGSKLYVGLDPAMTREDFHSIAGTRQIEKYVTVLTPSKGDVVFVPAGTVHAIGAGLVLAEIQQNSDITYRVYDWDRVDATGKPRALHIQKAMEVIAFGRPHRGIGRPISLPCPEGERILLAASPVFAAELLSPVRAMSVSNGGATFHILLAVENTCRVAGPSGDEVCIGPGQCLLVPASVPAFSVSAGCRVLDFYVPDLAKELYEPLLGTGYNRDILKRVFWDGA